MKKLNLMIFLMLLNCSYQTIYGNLTDQTDQTFGMDLESDDNDEDQNWKIPELGGQIPETPTAFDKFDPVNPDMDVTDGTQDDLDISIESKTTERLKQALLNYDSATFKKILENSNQQKKVLANLFHDPVIQPLFIEQFKLLYLRPGETE